MANEPSRMQLLNRQLIDIQGKGITQIRADATYGVISKLASRYDTAVPTITALAIERLESDIAELDKLANTPAKDPAEYGMTTYEAKLLEVKKRINYRLQELDEDQLNALNHFLVSLPA